MRIRLIGLFLGVLIPCVVLGVETDGCALVSWRDYTDARIQALEDARIGTAQSLEKRLDSMNEFRLQLRDQADTFVPRAENQVAHDVLRESIAVLRETNAEISGKASQTQVMIAYAFSLVAALIAVWGRIGPRNHSPQ